jgi:hypothetical protein
MAAPGVRAAPPDAFERQERRSGPRLPPIAPAAVVAWPITVPVIGGFTARLTMQNARFARWLGHSAWEGARAALAAVRSVRFSLLTMMGLQRELHAVLQLPEAKELVYELERRLRAKEPIDLWALTRARAATDEEATRWLAALFADTSAGAGASSGWLGEAGRALFDVRFLLREATGKLYPFEPSPPRTAVYHYYVVRYIADQLRAQGVPQRLAALTAFALNAEYEFSSGVLYGGIRTEAARQDFYLGYRAVSDALPQPALTFEEFSAKLTRRRREFLTALDLVPPRD